MKVLGTVGGGKASYWKQEDCMKVHSFNDKVLNALCLTTEGNTGKMFTSIPLSISQIMVLQLHSSNCSRKSYGNGRISNKPPYY